MDAEEVKILISDSHSSEVENNPSQKAFSPKIFSRTKKRKTRSERNKLRSKGKSKPESEPVQSKETLNFKRHAEMGRRLMKVQQPSIRGPSMVSITQNRLTQKVGLYNQGKASGTVARDVVIPDSVAADTVADIRSIIGHSPASKNNKPASISINSIVPDKVRSEIHKKTRSDEHRWRSCDSAREKHKHGGTRHVSDSPVLPRSACSIPLSPHRTPCEGAMAVDPSSPQAKFQHSSPDSFPPSPAFSDIAASILCELNPQKLYPGKDLVQETKIQLRKLLYQGPASDATSMKTPGMTTKTLVEHNLKGSLSSESVSRTSMDHTQQPASAQSSANVGGNLLRNILQNCDRSIGRSAFGAQTKYQTHTSHSHSDSGTTCSLFDRKPVHAPTARPKPMSNLEIKALTDGRAFLTLSERLMSSQENSERNVEPSVSFKESPSCNALELFASNDQRPPDVFGLQQQPCERMDIDCRPKVPQGNYLHNPQRAVVAEIVHPPTHIPRTHDDYYSLRNQDNSFHNLFRTDRAQSEENMDMLEYIDHSFLHQPSTSHMHDAMAAAVPMATDAMYPREPSDKQLLLRSMVPDTAGSPDWYTSSPHLPPKPPLNSPSPPHMLFPRRLY